MLGHPPGGNALYAGLAEGAGAWAELLFGSRLFLRTRIPPGSPSPVVLALFAGLPGPGVEGMQSHYCVREGDTPRGPDTWSPSWGSLEVECWPAYTLFEFASSQR